MTDTHLCVTADPLGRRARVDLRSEGPRGRGHIGVRMLQARPDGARVALVAEGALLVAGDTIGLHVRVGPGVTLEVVEPAGTVAYDMRGGHARWSVHVHLDRGARLVWCAEPLVVSAGARVFRTLTVELGPGAVAVLRETVVLGRAAESGGVLHQRMRVTGPEGALLAEDLDVDGAHPQTGVLQGIRVVDTVFTLGRRATGIPAPDGAHRLELDGEGTLLRWLGPAVHLSTLDAAWTTLGRRRHEIPA
ncbi:MAG: urease accessory protein UreD [Actinomycetota bacterium]|nr:urease accessory protein UreD [Actinomycetota bacterium]